MFTKSRNLLALIAMVSLFSSFAHASPALYTKVNNCQNKLKSSSRTYSNFFRYLSKHTPHTGYGYTFRSFAENGDKDLVKNEGQVVKFITSAVATTTLQDAVHRYRSGLPSAARCMNTCDFSKDRKTLAKLVRAKRLSRSGYKAISSLTKICESSAAVATGLIKIKADANSGNATRIKNTLMPIMAGLTTMGGYKGLVTAANATNGAVATLGDVPTVDQASLSSGNGEVTGGASVSVKATPAPAATIAPAKKKNKVLDVEKPKKKIHQKKRKKDRSWMDEVWLEVNRSEVSGDRGIASAVGRAIGTDPMSLGRRIRLAQQERGSFGVPAFPEFDNDLDHPYYIDDVGGGFDVGFGSPGTCDIPGITRGYNCVGDIVDYEICEGENLVRWQARAHGILCYGYSGINP